MVLAVAVLLLLLLCYTHKSYAPVRQILQRIEPQYQQQNAMDESKYIDMAVSDLTYTKKFLEQTNEELCREKYLYYILDNQVTTGSVLYQQCLSAGIRVDRHWFACILLEDTAENEKLFQSLNAEEKDSGQETNSYSMYIMDNKYMFLLCSDEKEDCLAEKLRQLSDGNDELVSVSHAVDSLENVCSVYLDVCQREANRRKVQILPLCIRNWNWKHCKKLFLWKALIK